ncbi:reverse transcriptase [Elysia marginata]|uniref:Reverse transcriptase n=1 Tax=Elysia marginata TaxID=1093978 RepID=A0AAV4HME8_9GAST|nr:reverse transcriptase [Elysia marginata]
MELAKSRGAQIRARIKWVEEGEKSTKFFLNLEKTRAQGNIINRLVRQDNTIVSSSTEILNEIRNYYGNLYKENKTEKEIMQSTSLFSKNIIFPQLKEEEKIKCDEELSEQEISFALKTMKNRSSPGPDGIPVEFYKMFWKDLKKLFIEAMKYSQNIGKLSPTQRQGTISLIHKGKELSKDTLTNWRPISLTNADYKIFSKALALRLSAVLPNIINENQGGFIKGRKISELIRELDDIIDREKSNPQSQSYTLSIDYSKAFDTISIVTIIEALRMFNFGEKLISWIKALRTERTANVKNGGSLSESFPLERGVRQGCPVSPLLFIIAVEILALNVRQDEKILGIQLPNSTSP